MHHPKNNFMSKWHLLQPLQREIRKKPTLISYILVRSKNLWSRITLYRACTLVCVWLVNTLSSTAPTGSPIICMWSPADVWEQWERNLSFSSADVRGAGTRHEPSKNVCVGGYLCPEAHNLVQVMGSCSVPLWLLPELFAAFKVIWGITAPSFFFRGVKDFACTYWIEITFAITSDHFEAFWNMLQKDMYPLYLYLCLTSGTRIWYNKNSGN